MPMPVNERDTSTECDTSDEAVQAHPVTRWQEGRMERGIDGRVFDPSRPASGPPFDGKSGQPRFQDFFTNDPRDLELTIFYNSASTSFISFHHYTTSHKYT